MQRESHYHADSNQRDCTDLKRPFIKISQESVYKREYQIHQYYCRNIPVVTAFFKIKTEIQKLENKDTGAQLIHKLNQNKADRKLRQYPFRSVCVEVKQAGILSYRKAQAES